MCLRLLILTKTILLGGLNTVEAGTGPWCRKCVNSTDPQQNPLHIGLVLFYYIVCTRMELKFRKPLLNHGNFVSKNAS